MDCPACQSVDCRRSRRRYFLDYLLGVFGVLPWRCKACEKRFHARLIPLRHIVYARCGVCGNLELHRIAPEKVPGAGSAVGRLLRLPALRCEPCRHKFFALRPALPMQPAPEIAAEDHAAEV